MMWDIVADLHLYVAVALARPAADMWPQRHIVLAPPPTYVRLYVPIHRRMILDPRTTTITQLAMYVTTFCFLSPATQAHDSGVGPRL